MLINKKYLIISITLFLLIVPYSSTLTSIQIQQINEETLTYAVPFEFSGNSIQTAFGNSDMTWMSAVYAGLLKSGSQHQRFFVPNLAESYSVNNDNVTILVTLRDNLKFSNGNNLTADDAVFSYKVGMSPDINQGISYNILTNWLTNASVVKIDDRQIEFTLTQPYAFFKELLTLAIIDQEIFQARFDSCDTGVMVDCDWNDLSGADTISAGPFMVQSIDQIDDIVTLVANPNYYNATQVSTDKLIFQYYPSADEALNALVNGTVDVVDSWFSPEVSDVLRMGNVAIGVVSNPYTHTINVNHLNPYFGTGESIPGNSGPDLADALLVRKAISYSIDREQAVLDTIELNGKFATPAVTTLSSIHNGWNASLQPTNYSITAARNYMTMAGFNYSNLGAENPDGTYNNFFFNVTVLSPNTNPARNKWATDFTTELHRIGIGVTANIITGFGTIIPRTFGYSSGTLVPDYDSGGFDIAFLGISVPGPDWNAARSYNAEGKCGIELCINYYNFDVYENQTNIGSILSNYTSEINDSLRLKYINDLQREMIANVPDIPILQEGMTFVLSNTVFGIDLSQLIFNWQEWDLVGKQGFERNTEPKTITSTTTETLTSTQDIYTTVTTQSNFTITTTESYSTTSLVTTTSVSTVTSTSIDIRTTTNTTTFTSTKSESNTIDQFAFFTSLITTLYILRRLE